jgi:hypothetical protein
MVRSMGLPRSPSRDSGSRRHRSNLRTPTHNQVDPAIAPHRLLRHGGKQAVELDSAGRPEADRAGVRSSECRSVSATQRPADTV